MSKLFAVVALAGATFASTMIATTDEAQAQRRWGPAVGIGIAAGVLAGAAIANSGPAYASPVRCGWVDQYDRWGNYMGRVRVCDTVPY
jgi:hypothetical protein